MQSVSHGGPVPVGFQNPFIAFTPHAMRGIDGTNPGVHHLHPAFLHPFYSTLPPNAAATAAAAASMRHNPNTGAPGKSKAFTIDAILGEGERGSGGNGSGPGMNCASGRSGPEGGQATRDHHPAAQHDPGAAAAAAAAAAALSRQHRLQAVTHPYLSPFTCTTPFAYRAQQNSDTKDKSQKKNRMSGLDGNGNEWKHGKSKRVRTIFTPEQLERLEAEFERQQYMVGTERYYLAAALNLTEAQVKVWFQNRRIKWRKQNLEQQHARLAQLDMLASSSSRSPSSSPSPHHHHHDNDLQQAHHAEEDVILDEEGDLTDDELSESGEEFRVNDDVTGYQPPPISSNFADPEHELRPQVGSECDI